MAIETKGQTGMTNPRPDDRDRYITCAVKMNGTENGRTEILDTHVDGGEGEPLIVASFFDRGEAEFFCRAGNREWRRCSVSPKPDSDPALIEAAERAERYEKALQSIAEYWNGSPNDSAMLDACQRNADYAKQVLEGATP